MTQPTTLEFGPGKVFAVNANGRVFWSGECTDLRPCVEADKPDEMPVDASRVASVTLGDCDLIGLRRKLDDLREPRPPELERERKP